MLFPFGTKLTSPSVAAATWHALSGDPGGTGSASDLFVVRSFVPYAGTVYAVTILIAPAPGIGKSWQFDVLLNGVSQGNVTISGAATTGAFGFNFAVIAGDYLQLKATPTGTPTVTTNIRPSVYIDDLNGGFGSWYCGGTNNNLSTTATQFLPVQGFDNPRSTETNHMFASTGGTITVIRVHLDVAPGVGKTRTFEIWLNGATASATVAITGAATSGAATISVAVVAGDTISIRSTVAGTPAAAVAHVSINFAPTTAGVGMFASSNNDAATAGPNRYVPFYARSAADTILGVPIGIAATFNSYRIDRSVAPGAGKTVTYVFYVNEAASAVSFSISGAVQTSNTDTTALNTNVDDRIVFRETMTAGTASGVSKYSCAATGFGGSPEVMVGCA